MLTLVQPLLIANDRLGIAPCLETCLPYNEIPFQLTNEMEQRTHRLLRAQWKIVIAEQ